MNLFAVPQYERQRLQAVHRFLNLKLNKEKELQEIVELAAELCETPISLITLIGEDIQYFKFKVGIDLDHNARKYSFCTQVVDKNEILEVPDTHLDTRFSQNPLVIDDPKIRFYAGAPLITHDGHFLGCLSVLDVRPRTLSAAQKHVLKVSAKRAIQMMEFDLTLKVLNEQFLQVKESEIKLRSFFESSAACHLLLGKKLEILAFNKNMAAFIQRIYQVTLYEGIHVNQILQGLALADFESDYQKALNGTPAYFQREVNYSTERIWWCVSFEPCINCDGEIIGISYNARDITEQKLREQQILEQNESLKSIAYVQSHELRKPVASIIGLMNIIEAENYTATKEDLLMMQKAASDLDIQIRKIVNYTACAHA